MKNTLYSIIFTDIHDPSKEETKKVIDQLHKFQINIIDQFPGTILVEAMEKNIKELMSFCPNWTYSANVDIEISK